MFPGASIQWLDEQIPRDFNLFPLHTICYFRFHITSSSAAVEAL